MSCSGTLHGPSGGGGGGGAAIGVLHIDAYDILILVELFLLNSNYQKFKKGGYYRALVPLFVLT